MGVIANKLQMESQQGGGLVSRALAQRPVPPPVTSKGVASVPGIKQATQFGIGVGSGLGKGLLSIPQGILSASQVIANLAKSNANYQPAIQKIEALKQNLYQKPFEAELRSAPGVAGKIVGSVAPYVASGGTTAALSNAATKGVGGFKGAGLARSLIGGATEGAANFGLGYGLTGGNVKEARNQALIAGALGTATRGVSEFTNATGFNKNLMNTVYKTDKKTVANIFDEATGKSSGNTQKLSRWALDKGIKGSLENQAKQVKNILDKSENAVIKSAEASNKRITIEPNLFKLAQKIQADFQDVGRGEIAKQADDFLRSVNNNSVSVKDAIKFRRLIDNTLRTKSSFNNPTLADNLAYWAEDLRGAINNVGEIGKINKDYAQAIKARDAIIKFATTVGNQRAISALEAYVLGGGAAAGAGGPALATVLFKKGIQSPRVTSNLAQTLKNTKSTAKGSALRSAIGSLAK